MTLVAATPEIPAIKHTNTSLKCSSPLPLESMPEADSPSEPVQFFIAERNKISHCSKKRGKDCIQNRCIQLETACKTHTECDLTFIQQAIQTGIAVSEL
jgi:hypothetical protein